MRLNAHKTAILALALLYWFSADCFARPMHRVAHKATAGAAAKHSNRARREVAKTRAVKGSRRHAGSRTAPVEISRVRSRRAKTHSLRRAISAPAIKAIQPELTVAEAAPQKATSEDFLKAASGQADTQPAVAIHGTARPDEPAESRPSTVVSARRRGSVAKPVPVISVVRPAAVRPQLPSVEEVVATPVILPALYNKRGRLVVPPPLRGSHEILLHQNEVADRDGLSRIQSDEDLLEMRNKRLLVAIPDSAALQVDERLPANRRYCRPWTAQFLATLARAHYAHFHTPLQVNSAVRTVEFQQHLLHINGNAAPAEGDTASPHLNGQAIDIAKHGLSLTEIAWMRGYLLPLVQEGKVDVEEEFQQSCFHISVYKRYMPSGSGSAQETASARHGGTSALAAALR